MTNTQPNLVWVDNFATGVGLFKYAYDENEIQLLVFLTNGIDLFFELVKDFEEAKLKAQQHHTAILAACEEANRITEQCLKDSEEAHMQTIEERNRLIGATAYAVARADKFGCNDGTAIEKLRLSIPEQDRKLGLDAYIRDWNPTPKENQHE